ncbi:hypothetical protein [Chamaesiphon minutus]|jgi:hypothetical protein|uniref:Uncharacterized protein n=1 Tax=Chamaesiphon minutus (strain ATCC 27169 / PCC 6605) TaxID=1173020 RepID=K9UDZ1_CHAP6|nr:hypothetical protein [Chamaesiphon minutus]AFY92848.1 hypothetical protein Cha6605_1723 [Chamaesiphon minutus PCC 6605]
MRIPVFKPTLVTNSPEFTRSSSDLPAEWLFLKISINTTNLNTLNRCDDYRHKHQASGINILADLV